MGGMHGFGPVTPEADEPVFHADWERRVFALTLAMGATGAGTSTRSRFARETLPPAEYLSSTLLRDLARGARAAARRARPGRRRRARRRPLARARDADRAHARRRRRRPRCWPRRADGREARAPARFAVGDRVRARNLNPPTHTRLPRYVRGQRRHRRARARPPRLPRHACARARRGAAVAVHGALRRARAVGRRRRPDRARSRSTRWSPTSSPPRDAARARSAAGRRRPGVRRAVGGAGVRDRRWRCTSAACSSGPSGPRALAAEIERAQAAGDPDTGETYYRHWLAALERLVGEQGPGRRRRRSRATPAPGSARPAARRTARRSSCAPADFAA